jgi:3'(2'), 5'-bisphosphate nucleotidase
MEWDIAAGHAIYRAVGGEVINLETNEPLIYNKESLFNPFFIASKNIMKL